MLARYTAFIRGVSVNRWGRTGVVLTTSAFFTFIVLELFRLSGLMTNAYMGLISYLLFPSLFVIGLILIPVGWWKAKKDSGKTGRELIEAQFGKDNTERGFFGSRIFLMIAFFTGANVLFLTLASMQMMSFMDEAEFCGTACHSVMSPEWTTYQDSPHARVACVECHVGEGVDALVASKLNGTWQMISITFDLLERPIPTPVHQLRPARETCEKCHWPEKQYGGRMQTRVAYRNDSTVTPEYTTLYLRVDGAAAMQRSGVHWHVSADNEVRYASVGDEREEMIWIKVRQADGSFKRFENTQLTASPEDYEHERVFDCVDCHNRATHIYEDPHEAIDKRITERLLDRSLPFIRREGLAALTASYPDSAQAMERIAAHIEGFYRRQYPSLATGRMDAIDSAIATLKGIYNRNIFHNMNIEWNAYPSHIGHRGTTDGCFRCHTNQMKDAEGVSIRSDCGLCHSILANQASDPYEILKPIDTSDIEYLEKRALQEEFLNTITR